MQHLQRLDFYRPVDVERDNIGLLQVRKQFAQSLPEQLSHRIVREFQIRIV